MKGRRDRSASLLLAILQPKETDNAVTGCLGCSNFEGVSARECGGYDETRDIRLSAVRDSCLSRIFSNRLVTARTMVTARTRTCVIALRGSGACHFSALRSDQGKQIADMRHDQTLLTCLDEYGECDHSLLNPSEVKEVSELERQRNLLSCQ